MAEIIKKRRASRLRKMKVRKLCKQENMDVLSVRPERGEPEYREAIVLENIPKQYYPWDMVRQGPEAAVPTTRRNLFTTKNYLQSQRRIENKIRRKNEKVWAEIRTKQKNMNETFQRYNKLLKENREKVERAAKKEEEESIKQAAIKLEIEELKESLNYYKRNKHQMKQQISIYTMYEAFLTKVIGLTSKYDTIRECSNMYDMMISAKNKISELETEGDSLLEKITKDMTAIVTEKNQEILAIHDTMKGLGMRYDRAIIFTRDWGTLIVKCQELIVEKNTERNIVKQMFYELYKTCCSLLGEPAHLDRNQMEEQLEVIKNFVQLQKSVLTKAKYYQELQNSNEHLKKEIRKSSKSS